MSNLEIHSDPESEEIVSLQLSGTVSKDGWVMNRDPLIDRQGEQIFKKPIAISLADVDYIDSTGVEWLLSCHSRCGKDGGQMVLHSTSPMAAQILQMMRMDLTLNIVETENEAFEKLKGYSDDHAQHESGNDSEQPATGGPNGEPATGDGG